MQYPIIIKLILGNLRSLSTIPYEWQCIVEWSQIGTLLKICNSVTNYSSRSIKKQQVTFSETYSRAALKRIKLTHKSMDELLFFQGTID